MDIKTLSHRTIKGMISLTFRRFALLAINFATINLFLARILPVETIGIFNIANSILAFFTFFSDIGLAAAIIQKKEVTEQDLRTTFTIQELLAAVVTVVLFFAAPVLVNIYNLDQSSVWLIRALAFGFLLTSLKVIPSVLLERYLKFDILVWVEIAETLSFNLLLITLSLEHFGILAFSWATVVRSLIGVLLIYILAPWKVGFYFSKVSAKSLLSFGVPFQLNSILALFKDRLVPLVIAKMVGPMGVGFITWAQSLAFLPLEVMNIIIRVTFPAFSRLQESQEELRKIIEKSLFLTAFFLYPMLFGLLALAPSLVQHIVSSKWQPALPLIYLFAFNAIWATISSPFTNAFNAIGKINITLKLMIMWTVLTWILSPLLTYFYGFIGVALASALIALTSIIPLVIIKRMLKVEVMKNIKYPLLCSILMSVLVFWFAQWFVKDIWTLILAVGLGGIIYLTLMRILARQKLALEWMEVKDAFSGN